MIGHILCRNCLLKHNIEGGIEMTKRYGRRTKQLLDDFKETIGFWKLKKQALGHTQWRTHSERECRPVVRLRNE